MVSCLDLKGAEREDLLARVIDINVPAGSPHGLFSTMPSEYDDSGEMATIITELTAKYCGAPAWTFLKKLVQWRADDEMDLIARITKHCNAFIKAVDVSPNDGLAYRRARVFGLAYAASQLARASKALPSNDDVGSYLDAFTEIWKWTMPEVAVATPSPLASAIKTLKNYVNANKLEFTSTRKLLVMSDKSFRAHLGFAHTAPNGKKEIIMSTVRFAEKFNFDRSTLNELLSKGILTGQKGTDKRHTTQRTVRVDVGSDPIKDRVVVINIRKLFAKSCSLKLIKRLPLKPAASAKLGWRQC